MFFEVTKDR